MKGRWKMIKSVAMRHLFAMPFLFWAASEDERAMEND